MKHNRSILGGLAALLFTTGLAVAGPGSAGHAHDADAAYGKPGDPKKAARIVPISMRETDEGKMAYFPDKVEVRKGEQVKFVLKNGGKVDHEFVLDTVENNAKHKIAMQKNPDMEHDDPNAKRLAVSQSGEILWQFTKAGEFEFACLIPGHYESGMKGTIVVK
ncbi:plastocyanin/azurin family copper-binding protein [Microvirga sp. 2MCAF38]|uniref:cupredoxin domain-containing protein n=1 Tax=Microvirga sp. 2MCAF38 TaxID=3232989 RepID=UPI003F9E404D